MSTAGCAGMQAGSQQPLDVEPQAPRSCEGALPQLAAGDDTANAAHSLIAFVSASQPAELVVHDASAQRTLFRQATKTRVRPELLGDVVLTVEEQNLIAFDTQTGKRRFEVALDRPLWLGAARIGDAIVYVTSALTFDPRTRGSTITLIDAKTGERRFQRTFAQALGRPTTWQRRIYVLGDQRDLLTLSPDTGEVLDCATFGDRVVHWIEPTRTGFFYGGDDVRNTTTNTSHPSEPAPPWRALPGHPEPHESAFASVPAERSAYGRVALTLVPQLGADGRVTFAGERYYFIFYRHVFAFDPQGQMVWAQRLAHDAVRSVATPRALVIVTDDGSLTSLDAGDGAPHVQLRLPLQIASADLAIGAQLPATAPSAPARQLRDMLIELANDSDARLLPSRELALDALARIDDVEAASALLAIYLQKNVPTSLRARAATHLRTHPKSMQPLLAALGRPYDYLEQQAPPPLAVILPAIMEQRPAGTGPALAAQLVDPQTPLAQLPAVIAALAIADDPQRMSAIADFLALYHADSTFAADSEALIAAARTLASEDPSQPAHRELLEHLAGDAQIHPSLRTALAMLTDAAKPTSTNAPSAERAQSAVPAVPTVPTTPRPFVTSPRAVLDAHLAELRACVDQANVESHQATSARSTGKPAPARLAFVARDDGTIEHVHVTPESEALESCLRTRLATFTFPRATRERTLVAYVIRNEPRTEEAQHAEGAPVATATSAEDFWSLSKARAEGTRATPAHSESAPWWQDQNPLFISIEPTTKPSDEGKRTTTTTTTTPTPTKTPGSTEGADHGPPPTPPAPVSTDASQGPDTDKAGVSDEWWVPSTPPR